MYLEECNRMPASIHFEMHVCGFVIYAAYMLVIGVQENYIIIRNTHMQVVKYLIH